MRNSVVISESFDCTENRVLENNALGWLKRRSRLESTAKISGITKKPSPPSKIKAMKV